MPWKIELEQLARIPDDGTPPGLVDSATSAHLAQFVSELRGLGQVRAPQPSYDLATVLAGATPIEVARRRRALRLRPRSSIFVIAAAGVAAVTLIGLAAANDSLPEPAQGFVSRIVNDWTPVHISVPQRPASEHSAPAATRSAKPLASKPKQKQSGQRVTPIQPARSAAPIAPVWAGPPAPPRPQRLPAVRSTADQEYPNGNDSTPEDVAPIPAPSISADPATDQSEPVDDTSASPAGGDGDHGGDGDDGGGDGGDGGDGGGGGD